MICATITLYRYIILDLKILLLKKFFYYLTKNVIHDDNLHIIQCILLFHFVCQGYLKNTDLLLNEKLFHPFHQNLNDETLKPLRIYYSHIFDNLILVYIHVKHLSFLYTSFSCIQNDTFYN